MSLESLEKAVERDLGMINCPPKPWKIDDGVIDVAIIGSGMAGTAAAFALMKQGITHISLFEARAEGKEGPWATYARMKTLRSTKVWMGPALSFPGVTFQAWFEAQFGEKAWENLGKIPTLQWMDYLKWYRKILGLPVKHGKELVKIEPEKNGFRLIFSNGEARARKVVLATGREGFGGMKIPAFTKGLAREKWAHTSVEINFSQLKGKKVGVIGGGASGFDAAAVALEHGAKSVDMILRRKTLPSVNKERNLYYPGLFNGYFDLPDEEKWEIYQHAFENGISPPKESLERVKKYPHFRVLLNTPAEKVLHEYDFLILATGFLIDGSQQPELASIMHSILLWKDRGFEGPIGEFPYLGAHLQFLEKKEGAAPFLKNLYCFNYAAILSHSAVSSDIPGISYGAERVAAGIAADFFLEDRAYYFEKFTSYSEPDFELEEYPFFQEQ
jgi:FAD-dependent urate hydroxylase